jgi:putative nucleotidyltransferase with HDIG domain
MKDSYTRGHSSRVADYAVAVAKKMGIADERVALVNYATILHDVGKIGIDERILTKPEALSEAEYSTIRLHTQMGDAIVQAIGFLEPVRAIVRSHHEWYNGAGYAEGLAGEAIPLEARIVSVADAFDAMTSNRAYRLSLDVAEAITRLQAGAGTQFDPNVVRLFSSMAHELRPPG